MDFKKNIGGRKLWGILSRNLERVGVDFQKAMLAAGNYGGFFRKFEEGLRAFLSSNIGGRKLWWNVLKKFGEGLRGFQKAILAGRNFGGIFQNRRKIWDFL